MVNLSQRDHYMHSEIQSSTESRSEEIPQTVE